MQMIIVCLVVVAAVGYAAYRVWKALADANRGSSRCAGCTGCQLSQLKNGKATGARRKMRRKTAAECAMRKKIGDEAK